MSKANKYSIRQRLTALNMLVSGAALLLACLAFAVYEFADYRDTLVRALSIESQIAGANSASALLFNDPEAAAMTLSALKVAPNIVSSSIYSPAGNLFATYLRDPRDKPAPLLSIPPTQLEAHRYLPGQLLLVRTIEFQGKRIGMVSILLDLQEVNDRLTRYTGIVVIVLLFSLLAAFVFSSVFQKATVRPIIQLAETARIVSREKKFSVRAPVETNAEEIAVLIDAFNEMLGQLQERDTALQAARDELETRVARRTSQLEAVNRELESFTYSVAHDLRAPLRHIQGFADALKEDYPELLESNSRELLDRIMGSTRRMDQLINDLLSLAHVGRQELHFKAVDLNEVVGDVVRDLALESQGRNIEWRLGNLPVVECDPGLMKLVFQNLLSNAVKYSRPRNPAVIETGCIQRDGEQIVFVRDNGVGFNMKYAYKLFGVFERLHRREDFEGTGVGLATVQRIVHKHGGRIWAEAVVDQGAVFYFILTGPGLAT